MTVRLKALAIVVACIAALTAPARSDTGQGPLLVIIAPQPDAPVEITNCYAWLSETVYQARVIVSVVFRVRPGSSAAKSVRFAFGAANAFDAPTMFTGTSEGAFAPGVRIDRAHAPIGTVIAMWNYPIAGSDVTKVACGVNDVAFNDGTIWHAPRSTNTP